ncbi:BolA family protein [Cereibacter johrii]|uniref:BolA protein n=1 Tax=Cereibacter johrii TaxID=445629 RepID=A0ABX5JF97_9RHOB|nr:BolA family protein [Cereibacter johrii]PTM81401.1 BolA protein [Cereibacter johrii]RDS95925.1 BolA family transcriptional regulator [Cereibacter sphaeroides f. sp. denitrificans]
MGVVEEIRDRLEAAFAPEELEVMDESEQHRGHGGWREGGETHFRVRMRAGAMAAKTRLERHRAVNAALGKDLIGRIHALALDVDG